MLLEIKKIDFIYDQEVNIFEQFTLNIREGTCLHIQGINGSGKTTLLRLLAGLLNVNDGIITLSNYPVCSNEYKKRMAFISDEPELFDQLNLEDHIDLVAQMWEITGECFVEYKNRVYLYLNELGLELTRKAISTYSLGMKYKLFFLMLARTPDLILMDEPFSSLDSISQETAIHILKRDFNHSIIIFSSHISELSSRLLNKHIIL